MNAVEMFCPTAAKTLFAFLKGFIIHGFSFIKTNHARRLSEQGNKRS
jgi:hypothetical protein